MARRVLVILGVLLLGAAAWVHFGKPEFARDKEVLRVGELSATVRQSESLPDWVAPMLAILGGAFAAAGLLRAR